MIEKMITEIKDHADPKELGMILVHNGIVRSTAKNGQLVKKLKLSFNHEKLQHTVADFTNMDGIITIKVWINQGDLNIGDDMMYLLVAGKYRKNVMPIFEKLLTIIKNEIIIENEIT